MRAFRFPTALDAVLSSRVAAILLTAATLVVATLAATAPFCAAAESDWAFDDAAFEARLVQDWLMRDVPDEGARARLFADAADGETADRAAEFALVDRILGELEKAPDAADFDDAAKIAELREKSTALRDSNEPDAGSAWRELYRAACKVRRARRLAVVAENAPAIVYTKHYVIGASHYAYTEDVSDEAYLDFSCNRQPGGQLCLATLQPDGSIKNEVLVSTSDGTIRDPDVSFDGTKILFSMRKSFTEDDFHLYEYDVETRETRQITSGSGVADVEPIYLPNGDVLFGSTRCAQITDCWWTEVSNFYVCDPEGRFLRRVSVDQVTVNYPKLLDDGRVVYTRWDYNDRGQIFPQPLFSMNVDGTGQTEYYGNNSYFPTTIMHARGIPGTDRVVAVAAGHHTYQHGKLIEIDRSKGTQENSGATLIAPVRPTPADRIDAYGQDGELFQYPFALDESNLLVAYLPEGSKGRTYNPPFGVYWFNFDGDRELLAFDPAISCGQPIPLAEREIPTTRASQVDLNQATGEYYVQDVYEGPGLAGIERGTIKALRVVALDFRAAGIRKNTNGGPAGGAMVATPVAIGGGTWDVKKPLGEVPVEEDGSVYFKVPALTPVYFQLLDERGDVVQTMRSWSTLQPGETFGCVGCHEPKGNIIDNNVEASGSTTLALRKGAAVPTPILTPSPGRFQSAGLSFVRDIQPILDSRCVRCHTGKANPDGGAAPFSLLGNEAVFANPSEKIDGTPGGLISVPKENLNELAGRRFSESYLNLTANGNREGPFVRWIGIQEGPEMLPPYFSGAAKSPMLAQFRADPASRPEYHRGVEISDGELRLIALWVDMLVPYAGDYVEDARWTPEERAHYEYYLTKRNKMTEIVAANVEKKREADATGEKPSPESFEKFEFGGLATREKFYKDFATRRFPSKAAKTGAKNVYRNLALNPEDIQGDAETLVSYPHATSNSEYAWRDEFAAKNVIDGKTENRGHGPAFPSWGPNLRSDLWLKIDFGTEVETDKIVLYLRADFPHDAVWKSATIEFSDGSTEKIELKETAEPQTFRFPKRRVSWVRLTDLTPEFPMKWSGVAEMEVWGVSVEK